MSFFPFFELDAATGTTPSTRTPVTASVLTTGGSGTDQANYTTASITPGANKLILLFTHNENLATGTAAAPTSISGAGLTFAKLIDGTIETSWQNGSVWYACAASPTSGTITINHAVTKEYCDWTILELDCDASPSDNGFGAIVQVGTANFTGAADSTAAPTVGLSAFQNVGNATVLAGFQENGATPLTSTPGTGLTELADFTTSSGQAWSGHQAIYFMDSSNQTPFMTNTQTASNFLGTVALEIKAKSASTGYSLTANGGSVAVVGQSVNLEFGHKLTASTGAVAVAGQNANLKYGRKVSATAGGASVAGQTVTLKYPAPTTLHASSGAVVIAGTSANLKRGLKLSASAGTIAVATQSATPKHSYTLGCTSGSLAVTGTTVNLKVGRRLASTTGSVAVAGTNTALKTGRKLASSSGPVVVTGQTAGLSKITGGYVLVASAGVVAASGQSISLITRRLENAQSASIGIAGTVAVLKRSRVVQASAAGVAVSGTNASVLRSRRIAASSGARTVTGQSVQLTMAHRLAANTGTALIAGQTAALLRSRRIACSSRAFDIVGFNAELSRIRRFQAGQGVFDVTGQSATVLHARRLTALIGDVLVIGTDADLTRQSDTDFAHSMAVSVTGTVSDSDAVAPIETSILMSGVIRGTATTGIDGRSVSITAKVGNLGND